MMFEEKNRRCKKVSHSLEGHHDCSGTGTGFLSLECQACSRVCHALGAHLRATGIALTLLVWFSASRVPGIFADVPCARWSVRAVAGLSCVQHWVVQNPDTMFDEKRKHEACLVSSIGWFHTRMRCLMKKERMLMMMFPLIRVCATKCQCIEFCILCDLEFHWTVLMATGHLKVTMCVPSTNGSRVQIPFMLFVVGSQILFWLIGG